MFCMKWCMIFHPSKVPLKIFPISIKVLSAYFVKFDFIAKNLNPLYRIIQNSNITTLAQTEVTTAVDGRATTTLFLEATRNGRHPIGIITSTLDKFINAGTTTEYMTQAWGLVINYKGSFGCQGGGLDKVHP